MKKKIIKFVAREVYGKRLEYVVDKDDAQLIQRLTGQKTINGVTRELFRDLSGGNVDFQQVLADDVETQWWRS